MDETAVIQIGRMACDAQNMRIPMPYSSNVAALPGDYKLHDLEVFGAGRLRYRGSLATASLVDFVGYIKSQTGVGLATQCYIDADNLAATAYFNLGSVDDAGHGDWNATLTMKQTAAFAALRKIDGRPGDQRGLIDFIEDWREFLSPIAQDHDAGITMARAISAIRSVTVKASTETETTQGDFNASRSSLEEIEARSKHVLPAGFYFTTEPYLGLPSRNIRLRLSVLTSGKEPMLVLRIVQKEAVDEEIAQDFKEVLLREVGDAASMTIGTFTP